MTIITRTDDECAHHRDIRRDIDVNWKSPPYTWRRTLSAFYFMQPSEVEFHLSYQRKCAVHARRMNDLLKIANRKPVSQICLDPVRILYGSSQITSISIII